MKFIAIVKDCRTVHGNFFNGEIRKVPEEVAGHLTGAGWASDDVSVDLGEVAGDERPEPVTLEVQNAKLGVNAETVGNG